MKLKKVHQLNIRIYFEDTDSGGIVYHSKYLNFAERARTELLRKINIDQSIIEKKYGLIFVVKKLNINYISTASLDDSLVVKTKILELNKAKVIFSQLIYKNKILISKLEVTVCCLNKNRKITRMNNKIYDILNSERELYE
jgi:acyl-CoA thioester hydrolase